MKVTNYKVLYHVLMLFSPRLSWQLPRVNSKKQFSNRIMSSYKLIYLLKISMSWVLRFFGIGSFDVIVKVVAIPKKLVLYIKSIIKEAMNLTIYKDLSSGYYLSYTIVNLKCVQNKYIECKDIWNFNFIVNRLLELWCQH